MALAARILAEVTRAVWTASAMLRGQAHDYEFVPVRKNPTGISPS